MPRTFYKEIYYDNGKNCFQGMGYERDGVFFAHGRGKKYDENGILWYDGEWVNDAWNGVGKEYSEDGTVAYDGEWLNGKRDGDGKWYYVGGVAVFYEGQFMDGTPCGEGKQYTEQGTLRYEGEWSDGLWQGIGKTYYANGILEYVGNFQDGKCCGKGILYSDDGTILYDGEWVDGRQEGVGKLFDNGVLWYEGDVFNGIEHGRGKAYLEDGSLVYEGEWEDGEMHGEGKLYNTDGTLKYEGHFEKGEIFEVEKGCDGDGEDDEDDEGISITVPIENKDIETCLEELNSMIGLSGVKQQVNSLVNLIRLQKEREARHLPIMPMTYHMVFTGNPGTGKTTVARLMGQIFANLGVVSEGIVVETDRTGLVGAHIGETAQKTERIIKKALGGVLFIDEAYSLVPPDSSRDFGKEAIDCLLKRMEDYRDDFVVIVAGYKEPMDDFLESNPGLKSRFNHHIYFDNYTVPELLKILDNVCKKNGYTVEEGFQEQFSEKLEQKMHSSHFMETFSNGRYVRNLFEKLVMAQSNRLAKIDITSATDKTLTELTCKDLKYIIDNREFEKTF